MKIVICIPTYNERENIGPLLKALQEKGQALGEHDFAFLVVDDNSPDGTQDVVKEIMEKNKNVHLLTGEKKGLGVATMRGFDYSVNTLGADVVVTMDADFSHSPQDVPRLIQKLEEGSDFVIGSRYVEGGSIPSEWGLHRKILSFFGNVVARVLGVWRVHDQTPAFRAIRSDVLEKTNLKNMPDGYAFQIALVCRANDAGARFAEVPIHFVDRTEGQSKMPARTIFETLWFLIKYRMRKVFGS
ncbi:MAG: polyprenol monophosphomannose synthase [Patescibacteria group bacterium]